jgi:hypothetical protein
MLVDRGSFPSHKAAGGTVFGRYRPSGDVLVTAFVVARLFQLN